MIKCSPGSTGLSQPIECDWQISCCFQRLKSLQFARITALSPSTPCNFRALRTRSTASNRVRHIRGNPSLCLCTRQTLNLHSSYTYTPHTHTHVLACKWNAKVFETQNLTVNSSCLPHCSTTLDCACSDLVDSCLCSSVCFLRCVLRVVSCSSRFLSRDSNVCMCSLWLKLILFILSSKRSDY